MNFIEAVQALKDGRCEGITRKCWGEGSVLTCNGFELKCPTTKYIPYADDFLIDDWQPVNERPQYEEVEVVRWLDMATGISYMTEEDADCGRDAVKLTGTHKRPIKPKVKRREEIRPDNSVKFACSEYVPVTGVKFYAEWESE